MKKNTITIKTILTSLTVLISFNLAKASFDEEDYNSYENYDSIVGDLSSRTSRTQNDEVFDLDSMKLHAGFGFNNSIIALRSQGNQPSKITMQGFEISLGVDLFSPNLITEVALINYNSESKDSYKYSLKEFDIKTYYRYHLNRIIALRGGAGLGVRYFDVNGPENSNNYTAPVAQILAGGEAKLGKKLSFITELSYKNAMSSSSPERAALDLNFKVDGHF